MKTLYNTQTQKPGMFYEGAYIVDGQPGDLPAHIIELEVVEVERPTITDLQKISMAWVADIQNLEYRQEWTVTDLTEAEALERRNFEAEAMDENIPTSIIRKILVQKIEAEAVTEEDLVEYTDLFPAYRVGYAYAVDDKFRYGEQLYKVVQPHTSQFDWYPDILPALYTPILPPGQIGEWVQPTGAHDTYQIGDQVTWNGFTWESTVDNNSWAPGEYGWIQI